MNPIVSIIIPCYNHGLYIEEAIRSVEQSTDKSTCEIIIVNDGSTDTHTQNVLKSLEHNGYCVLHQNNSGLAAARNTGIKESTTNYLITLDADDRINSTYFESGINILENNQEISLVYGQSSYFGDENGIHKPGTFHLKKLLVSNYINACILFRKEIWIAANGFDTGLTAYEDWDFLLNVAALGYKFHYIPEIVYDYRITKNSMLRSHKNLEECIQFIAKKHGLLYRNEFMKNITITQRLKSSVFDLFKKIIGKPNY